MRAARFPTLYSSAKRDLYFSPPFRYGDYRELRPAVSLLSGENSGGRKKKKKKHTHPDKWIVTAAFALASVCKCSLSSVSCRMTAPTLRASCRSEMSRRAVTMEGTRNSSYVRAIISYSGRARACKHAHSRDNDSETFAGE